MSGIWRLSRVKSSFSGAAPASRTMKVDLSAGGLTVVIETVVNNGRGADEGQQIVRYSAKLDGQDNPIDGSALDRIAFRRIGPRVLERTGKVRGEATETQRWTLSPDGKVLTLSTMGSSDTEDYSRTEVFER